MRLSPFDPAAYLETEEDRAFYLQVARADDDRGHAAGARDDVERSRRLHPSAATA